MTLLRLKSKSVIFQKTRLFTRALCRRTKEGHKLTVVRDSARSIVVGYLTRMNRWVDRNSTAMLSNSSTHNEERFGERPKRLSWRRRVAMNKVSKCWVLVS